MAHTNAWSDSIPLGSINAALLDDHIRQARLDVHERMNDILGGANWLADPVIDHTSYKQHISALTANTLLSGVDVSSVNGLGKGINSNGTAIFNIPIALPVGVTLTDVLCYVSNYASNSWTFKLYEIANNVATQIATATDTAISGNGTFNLGTLTKVILADKFYVLQCTASVTNNIPGGSPDLILFGIRLSYTKPGLANSF